MVKLLDEWEVKGLGTRFWMVTPNAANVAKGYAPRNCCMIMEEIDMGVWVIVMPVTNILTIEKKGNIHIQKMHAYGPWKQQRAYECVVCGKM